VTIGFIIEILLEPELISFYNSLLINNPMWVGYYATLFPKSLALFYMIVFSVLLQSLIPLSTTLIAPPIKALFLNNMH